MKKPLTLLLFLLLFLSWHSKAAVTGSDTVCAGEKVTYYVPYVTGASYSWSITGGTALTVLNTDSLVIQWGAAGTGTIIVTQFNPSAFHTLNVVIMPKPHPLITHLPYPGCPSDTGNGGSSGAVQHEHIQECEKVCKLATITYSTTLNAGSTYQWIATGAQTIVGANTNSVTVTWDTTSIGSLVVYETNQWGCTDSSEICIEKLNLPKANFTHLANACKFSSVLFNNLSTGATWYDWYFGDGGSSLAQVHPSNPSHSYSNAGTYTITLIAYNACHCSDTFQSSITIDSLPGPTITCPSTVCAFDTASYSTAAGGGCIYNWFAIGGTIVGPNNQPTVTVAWGPGQTGTLGLVVSGCVGVCSDTTLVYVPIVPATATITGATRVCPGDCEYYTLPLFSGAGYTWHLNNGSCGTANDTVCCNQVRICWPNLPYPCNDTLTVAYYDTFLHCGGTGQLVIRMRPRLDITGNSTVCANSLATFIATNSVPCFWSISPSTPIITGSPGPAITVNWLNTPGTYLLKAWPVNPNNACNDTAFMTVKVVPPPAKPTITGDTIVCPNSSVNYCANNAAGTVTWVITGGTPVNGVGNCLTVLWGATPPFIVRAYTTMTGQPMCNSDTTVQNCYPSSTAPPNITGSSPFCANSTNTFTASGLYAPSATYSWSLNLFNSGSVLSPGSQTTGIQWGNNAPQTVTVTATVNVCGVTVSNTTIVSLNPVPNPTVTQLGPLCAGGSSQLQATGGGTYSWSGPSGFTSGVANPTINLAGLYQVTVTDANLCTALSQKTVQYVGGPTASISTFNNLGYCIGSSYAVNICALGNAGYSYAWSAGGPPTQCRTFNSPGAISVTVTDINGCTAASNILVIHEDSCNGGGPGNGCTANPTGIVQFNHTNCSPMSFTNTSVNCSPVCTWDFGDNTTSNVYNPTHTYTQAGFYLVTLTQWAYNASQTDSCLRSDTAHIAIPVAAKFDTLTGCWNDPVCFTDASTHTAGSNITGWLRNFGDANTSNLQNPCHTYASAGVYTVTLTVTGGGCTSVYTQTITVPAQPNANFNFSGPNCINQPVAFTDLSTININYWNWAFGDAGTSLNQNPFHSYFLANIYPVTLIVHDIRGCRDTITKNVTISAPTLSGNIMAFPDTIVCAGTNVLLVAPPCGSCTYSWSNNSTNDSIIVTATGIYSVTITDAGGCPYVTFIRIIVNNAPPAIIVNSGDADLCLGESTFLSVPYNIKWTYQWISNDPNVNGQTVSQVFVYSPGIGVGVFTYQVVVTDTSTGCGDTSLPYVVTVHAPPLPPIITPLSATTVCKGDTIVLMASHPDPSVTLEWTTGAITDTIYVTEDGCYGVQATDTFGCTSTATICVTVNPLPDLCTFYEGCFDTCAPYTIIGPYGVGYTYQWQLNGNNIFGATQQTYATSVSGAYSVIVTNGFGCIDTTGVLNLTLYPCPDSLCADLTIDSVGCDSLGHQVIFYHVTNESQIAITQVNLEVLQPHLNVAFAPVVNFITIPSGGTSPTLTATVYNGNPEDTLCFRAHISTTDSMGMEQICCYSDTDCVILPPCDSIPTDTNCCFFQFISDSIWCVQTPQGTKFNFLLKIRGCGQMTISSSNQGILNVNNPYTLINGINTIPGSYIATGPNDTILCLTFVVTNGTAICKDTTICFRIECKQHPMPCLWDYNTVICVGSTTSFNYYGNPTGLTFNWSFPGGSPATATGPGIHNITYNTPGVYPFTLTITNANGSTTCTDSMHVMAAPVAVVTQVGNTLNAFPSGMSYQWFNGPPSFTVIPSQTNQFYSPPSNGNYCVMVSNQYGCHDTACIDFHYIEDGINELNENSWGIYPNPNDGSFTLVLDLTGVQMAEMKVVDGLGQVVDLRTFDPKVGHREFFISNKNFAAGIYFIQLKTDKGVGLKRMMVKQ